MSHVAPGQRRSARASHPGSRANCKPFPGVAPGLGCTHHTRTTARLLHVILVFSAVNLVVKDDVLLPASGYNSYHDRTLTPTIPSEANMTVRTHNSTMTTLPNK